ALYSKLIQITVTTSVGAGTKVIVDGTEHEAPFSTRWLSDDFHTIGVQAYQQVAENIRYGFEQWLHGGERVQNVSPSENDRYVAKLDTQYYVSVVTLPAELCQLPGSDWYVVGSHIEFPTVENIIEQSGKYWRFRTWKINDEEIETDSTFFLVSEPMVVAACFEEAFKISGSIKLDDQPLENVQIIISGDAADTVHTLADGEYAIPLLFAGNYDVVPQKEGYRFEPEKRSFSPLNTSLNEQDFAAIEIGTELSGEQEQPEKFCLGQNYPNPFNSTTSIPIELPHNSVITLKVFNILGQPVKTLIHDNNLTGVQKIKWNGTDDSGESVPSGVYFYKLMIDGRVLTKKMILLE
ncbi:T9SS type A sorting domain-containing protein, partial [candidate division KSB1 bacterium]|nr:T9SS type A sorting domain-containing protein [candidate division KSB1 bacterium]